MQLPENCRRYLNENRVASSLGEEPFVRDRFYNRHEIPLIRIKISGLLTTINFQKAQLIATKLHQHLPFRFSQPEIRPMLQVEWYEYLEKMRRVYQNNV